MKVSHPYLTPEGWMVDVHLDGHTPDHPKTGKGVPLPISTEANYQRAVAHLRNQGFEPQDLDAIDAKAPKPFDDMPSDREFYYNDRAERMWGA